jgi:hypothetical protein
MSLHRGLEAVEGLRARVGLVAGNHAGPLRGDIAPVPLSVSRSMSTSLGPQQKRVVARRRQQPLPALPAVVKRIGSTERMRKGSMMVRGWNS